MIMLFILLSGCYNKKIPSEVESFISDSGTYWYVLSSISMISLSEITDEYERFISVSLASKGIPEKYEDYIIKAYEIFLWDSRQKEDGISWRKKKSLDEPFQEPRIYEVVDVVPEEFLKQDFDNSKKDISISKKRIGFFKSIDVESCDFQDWVCYKTKYNLKGAKGYVPVKLSKGELILLISKNKDKLREAYISEGQWSFIRHVEIGRLDLNISNTSPDPNELLELSWRCCSSR